MTKNKLTAKPIMDNTWILYSESDKVGLLTHGNGVWRLIKGTGFKTYETVDELCDAENLLIEFQDLELPELADDSINNIDWFPVNCVPHNIEKNDKPTFSKNARSKVRYVAGYWAIKFANGWAPALCPKQETVESHDSVGPFTTKLEMNIVIAQKKRQS